MSFKKEKGKNLCPSLSQIGCRIKNLYFWKPKNLFTLLLNAKTTIEIPWFYYMWSKLLLTTTEICKNFSQGRRRGSKDPKKPTVWSLNQALVSWGLDSNLGGEVSLVSLIPSLRRGKFWNSIPCIAYSALRQVVNGNLQVLKEKKKNFQDSSKLVRFKVIFKGLQDWC